MDKANHIICRDGEFYDYFLYDVQNLSKRLIIYSPFMTSNRLAILLPYFSDVITKGKEIIVVTKTLSERGKKEIQEYRKLEEQLKSIGVQIMHKKGMHEKIALVDDSVVWVGSLNVLSFSEKTGEIMERVRDEAIVDAHRKVLDLEYVETAVDNKDELSCPICKGEMLLAEGDTGLYWKCINDDYSRNISQAYPHDGILKCHCGGSYIFEMKAEPKWVCLENSRHQKVVRETDLKLEKMCELLKKQGALRQVKSYFNKKNHAEANKKKAEERAKTKTTTKRKNKTATEDVQMSLFDID